MKFTFLIYIIFFIPLLVFAIWVSKERALKEEPTFAKYLFGLLLLLGVWGELSIYLKQWYYPKSVNLGIYIGNHPIEAYILGIVTPIFIISLWEFIKRRK